VSRGPDIFYDARLVEETRLHLATILDGRYSEQFYYCFFKIIERKTYLGYYTFKNKQIQLKGIVDFIHSKHYGFGLNSIEHFMIALSDAMVYDETESQYARQTVKWLAKQSPLFKLPRKVYEFERLLSWVRFRKATSRVTNREIRIFIHLYNAYPEYLPDVGEGRKFKTFEQAGIAAGIVTKIPGKNIRFNIDMTIAELEDVAEKIYDLLGPERNCKLIELLINAQEAKVNYVNGGEAGEDYADSDDYGGGHSQPAALSLCNRIREGGN
jgi:hypothetical protein